MFQQVILKLQKRLRSFKETMHVYNQKEVISFTYLLHKAAV